MPIVNLFGMWFEWHDDKFDLVNIKRGYTLEEIASVFDDDYRGNTAFHGSEKPLSYRVT